MQIRRDYIAGVLVVLGSRLATLPRSLWEFDEPLFIEAVWRYQPLHHHPPPPGYPVFIALGKLLNFFFHDPLVSLVAVSLLASCVGFLALAKALERLSGDAHAGLIGSLLFYFSPAMLVHSTLPISDPPALALLSVALLSVTQLLCYGTRGPNDLDAVLVGVFGALAVGCRPQFAIAIVPMLVWVVIAAPGWRFRWVTITSFGVTCVLWFVPLVFAAGGPKRWSQWMAEQASYFASHDAAISRGGKSWIQIGFRFIAHPWGPKWLSFPLLLAAAVGFFRLFRFKSRGLVAFALLSIPYVVFCLFMMDPADGPRYALPSLPFVALLAAAAIVFVSKRYPPAGAYAIAAAFMVGSATYVSTFIAERGRSASPPVQAAQHASRTIPKNSVILYELPLWPHAKLLFKDYTTMRIDDGLREFSHRAEVPLFLYADGERGARDGKTFRWIETDAYGKLTRNHYRVVSIMPVPPSSRYRLLSGIYSSERTVIGEEWRWLQQEAELELPNVGARRVAITLGTPRHYPLESNSVEISLNGAVARTVELRRDQSREVVLDLPPPPGPVRVKFRAAKSFVPAELPNTLDRDPRRLSVKLLRIVQD